MSKCMSDLELLTVPHDVKDDLDGPFGPHLRHCFRGGVVQLQWLQLPGNLCRSFATNLLQITSGCVILCVLKMWPYSIVAVHSSSVWLTAGVGPIDLTALPRMDFRLWLIIRIS